jgi:hypothetical protein
MNLIRKINYDDEGIYDISYFNNGIEISFEDYIKIENALEEDFDDYDECEFAKYNYDEDYEDYEECCGCCDCCEEGLEQPCDFETYFVVVKSY